jgi:hypothetical protein
MHIFFHSKPFLLDILLFQNKFVSFLLLVCVIDIYEMQEERALQEHNRKTKYKGKNQKKQKV